MDYYYTAQESTSGVSCIYTEVKYQLFGHIVTRDCLRTLIK